MDERPAVRRARERVDRLLGRLFPGEFGPAFVVGDPSAGKQTLRPVVACNRCGTVVQAIDLLPYRHYLTHHPVARLRAFLAQTLTEPDPEPDYFEPQFFQHTEPREDDLR